MKYNTVVTCPLIKGSFDISINVLLINIKQFTIHTKLILESLVLKQNLSYKIFNKPIQNSNALIYKYNRYLSEYHSIIFYLLMLLEPRLHQYAS